MAEFQSNKRVNLGLGTLAEQSQILEHLFMHQKPGASKLEKQLSSFNINEIFANQYVLPDFSRITAPLVYSLNEQATRSSSSEAFQIGHAAYQKGQVALMILAGGQGTRLGSDQPKGCYKIQALNNKSIFQIHFESILDLQKQCEELLPIILLTSDHTDSATRTHFEQEEYFGLNKEQILFVQQGTLPNFRSGTQSLLLAKPGELLMSPNGHGGFLEALAQSESPGQLSTLDRLVERGVKLLDMIQIDNILAKIHDPLAIGTALNSGLDITTRVFEKAGPTERVGNYVMSRDQHQILEYTDVTDEHTRMKQGDKFVLNFGSSGSHIFALDFLIKHKTTQLPFHISKEKLATAWDNRTNQTFQTKVDKPELFNFDLLTHTNNTMGWEISRSESFAPIKNATGTDSVETATALYKAFHKMP